MKTKNIAGNNIRTLRIKKGFTQEELALQSGLSQGYINRLENGRRRYTQKCLELIVKTLSVPMGELFAEGKPLHASVVRDGFNMYKTKHPSKSGFVALINELPKHIVEHYFILMTMENEIFKKK